MTVNLRINSPLLLEYCSMSVAPGQSRFGKPIGLHIVFLVLTPLLVAILVPWWVFVYGITWQEISGMVALWIVSGMGITVGYHRLFAHCSFKVSPFLRWIAAICGGAAWQGSALQWSSGHRYHHNKVDTDLDPYNAKRGFWWSHMGWIMFEGVHGYEFKNVPDLKKDPVCVWQHKYYLPSSIAFNLGIPALLGWWTGNFWGMMLFAGLVRVVLVHHFTFFINSLAHIMGSQPWSEANTSRDNWLISLFTFGEGYHNYHHAFAGDYRNGPKAYNFDPSKWLIWILAKLGLAYDLRRIADDVVLRRQFDESLMQLDLSSGISDTTIAQDFQLGLDSLQQRIEQVLVDLRDSRQRFSDILDAYHLGEEGVSRKHVRSRRKLFRQTRRKAKRMLREWESVLRGYKAAA